MTKQVQWRRGTQTQHEAFTGAEGEVTVDTTNDAVRVHDGVTEGGHLAAKKSEINATNNTLSEHVGNQSNPHGVTPEQLGLGNVDNTSDADKPVSDATQGELNELEDRISDVVEDAARSEWTLTFDGEYQDALEVMTDQSGRVIDTTRDKSRDGWTLVFEDEGFDGAEVVLTDYSGGVIGIVSPNGSSVDDTSDKVPALSAGMVASAATGIADESAAWYADIAENGAPVQDALNTNGAAVVLSTDPTEIAARLPMVNRMVPMITQCYRSGRVFRCYYGNNGPLGTNPEHTGYDMFMLIEYTDDFADGGVSPPVTDNETDDVTWNPIAVVNYTTNDDALVQDGQFFYTHQGYLVFCLAVRSSVSEYQTNFAWVIENPDTGVAPDLDLETAGTFVFGPQTFFGYGYAFQPHVEGTEQRFFMSGIPVQSYPRPIDQIPRYCRLRIHETLNRGVVTEVKAYSQTISELPIMVDTEQDDFPEPTGVPVGGDEIFMSFRAKPAEAMTRRSYDGGLTWDVEQSSYLEREIESTRAKTVLCRSPSGRLVWAFNNNGNRFNLSILFSNKGSKGADEDWLTPILIDGRARPYVSYPSITFLRDALGRYTGKFLMAYDRGRSASFIGMSGGFVEAGDPGSTTYNEIITALIDEETAVVNGADPYSRYTTNPAPEPVPE